MRRLPGLLTAALLAAVLLFEVLARTPQPAVLPALDLPESLTRLVLVVHGSQDSDNPQFAEIQRRLGAGAPDETAVRYLDWSPWSDQRLRAGATARRLGSALGAELARDHPGLEDIVLVMHSAGAWIGDALCERHRTDSSTPARIEMVFLDAFQIRGFADWSNGARHHGRCADFALSLLNTDDPAPSTNWPLRQAFNLDVTGHPGRAGFERNGHYWPVEYFLRHMSDPGQWPAGLSHAELPRGEVCAVPCGRLPDPA